MSSFLFMTSLARLQLRDKGDYCKWLKGYSVSSSHLACSQLLFLLLFFCFQITILTSNWLYLSILASGESNKTYFLSISSLPRDSAQIIPVSVLSLMALFYTDIKSQAAWGWKAPLDIIRSTSLLVVSHFFAYSIPSTVIRGLTEFASLCRVMWGLRQRIQNPTCTLKQNQLCYTRWYDLGCIQAERNNVFILAT